MNPETTNWESVWPAAQTFKPSVVPLPVRQGFVQLKRSQVTPGKYANAELMKIPNFLHLTPPVIKRHCDVLRDKFCTPFPEGDVAEKFPLTKVTSSYLNTSSSIRDKRARVVTIKVNIADLKLDKHAEQKLIRLAGPKRVNIRTGVLSITADACPHRKQNTDYAEYLLTVLYHEAQRCEEWETSTKTEADMIEFDAKFIGERERNVAHPDLLHDLMNEGESQKTLEEYGEKVEALWTSSK